MTDNNSTEGLTPNPINKWKHVEGLGEDPTDLRYLEGEVWKTEFPWSDLDLDFDFEESCVDWFKELSCARLVGAARSRCTRERREGQN